MHEARSEALAFGIEEWLLQSGLFDDRPPLARDHVHLARVPAAIRALSDLGMHSGQLSLADALAQTSEGIPYAWGRSRQRCGLVGYRGDVEGARPQLELRRGSQHDAGTSHRAGAPARENAFTIRKFFDEFMSGGIVPIALTHWELTGVGEPTELASATEAGLG